MSCFSSCNRTHSSWSARCPSTAAERCERSEASALLRSGRCAPYAGRCPYAEPIGCARIKSRLRTWASPNCFSSASTYLQPDGTEAECGGQCRRLMGMGERGVQGLTTAATGPLDLRGPSEAVILEAVLLGPSTAGSTCRRHARR